MLKSVIGKGTWDAERTTKIKLNFNAPDITS